MKQQALADQKKRDLQKAVAVLRKRAEIKRNEKEIRFIKRIAMKVQETRVRKPKPKRRPKNTVTIISVGGQPVEGVENEYKQVN